MYGMQVGIWAEQERHSAGVAGSFNLMQQRMK